MTPATASIQGDIPLQTFMDGVSQMVWRSVKDGSRTWVSPQWARYSGQADADGQGWGWLIPLHPEDRPLARALWGSTTEMELMEMELRIRSSRTGAYRWFQMRAAAVRDGSNAMAEWVCTCTDVDDLRQLQSLHRETVADIQHRVRNILMVVRSVFGATMEGGGDTRELIDHFRGRLDSLARTQLVVTTSADGRIDLENLIRDELLSIGVREGEDFEIGGPDVELLPGAAEGIGMAIHELTTNAVKFGAFKAPGGHLSIGWTIEGAPPGQRSLALIWTERNVPALALNPAHRGFGSKLIEEALPYQWGARTRLEFQGGGVRCSIRMPLPADDGEADRRERLQ